MSWHYLREQEGEFLEDICLGGEPLQPLKSKTTHAEFYCNGKLMDSYLDSLSGMTFALLKANLGEEKSISSQVDFLAKTSQQLEKEMDLKVNDQDCGKKWRGSFTRYDPDSSSWKTHQCSLLGDLDEFLETWPQWGLMQDGECWELTLQDLTISETESGLLPTVLATDWKGGTTASRPDNGKLRFDQWRDYVKLKHGMTYPHPTHSELRMGWPINWTDLKPLGMDKFRQWQQQHGEC
jgi:hypothetical protein